MAQAKISRSDQPGTGGLPSLTLIVEMAIISPRKAPLVGVFGKHNTENRGESAPDLAAAEARVNGFPGMASAHAGCSKNLLLPLIASLQQHQQIRIGLKG
jgi:hypothetical protein